CSSHLRKCAIKTTQCRLRLNRVKFDSIRNSNCLPLFLPRVGRNTSANGESADDPGTAFAEADRRVAVAPAMGAEDHLVAVLEKRPGLAVVEGDRALAGVAQFAQAAIALFGRSRDCAAAENVAGQQIA